MLALRPQDRLQQSESEGITRPKEIAFDDINEADNILIQTKHDIYKFSVLDPLHRRGTLTGGSFGDRLRDATLIGVLVENTAGLSSDTSGLRTDSCALFYVKADTGFKRLTTSIITDLIHIKAERGQPYPIS